jgi:sulfur carrier protein ThiS
VISDHCPLRFLQTLRGKIAMKIEIEFIGFPVIYDLFPEGRHPYSFPGNSIPQLVEDLIVRYGQRLEEALRETGTKRMDPTIQVRINGKFISKEEIAGRELGEGDQVTFLKLLAGG